MYLKDRGDWLFCSTCSFRENNFVHCFSSAVEECMYFSTGDLQSRTVIKLLVSLLTNSCCVRTISCYNLPLDLWHKSLIWLPIPVAAVILFNVNEAVLLTMQCCPKAAYIASVIVFFRSCTIKHVL